MASHDQVPNTHMNVSAEPNPSLVDNNIVPLASVGYVNCPFIMISPDINLKLPLVMGEGSTGVINVSEPPEVIVVDPDELTQLVFIIENLHWRFRSHLL